MRDIPVFSTEYGVASLFLRNVAVLKSAYIKIHDTSDPDQFIKECCDFCRAVGAEKIFASGVDSLSEYKLFTSVVCMVRSTEDWPDTEGNIFPLQETTMEKWRNIYNQKMRDVPNAALMTRFDVKKLVKQGAGYFVHKDGQLLGIGVVEGNRIEAIASVVKGAGREVLLTLCKLISDASVELCVSDRNEKAMNLYKALGFIPTSVKETWYQII